MDVAATPAVCPATHKGVKRIAMPYDHLVTGTPNTALGKEQMYTETGGTSNCDEADILENTLDLFAAACHAEKGEFDEAETLLCESGRFPSTCAALDLLARILVRKGQVDRARMMWKQVLKIEPGHEGALAAMRMLDTPWRIKAWGRLVFRLSGLSLVTCFALYGAFHLGEGGSKSEKVPEVVQSIKPKVRTDSCKERVVTLAHPPTRSELASLSNLLTEIGSDCWISVACAADPLSTNGSSRGLGFKRSACFAESFTEVLGFPYERVLIATTTNLSPPFATLRIFGSQQERHHETAY